VEVEEEWITPGHDDNKIYKKIFDVIVKQSDGNADYIMETCVNVLLYAVQHPFYKDAKLDIILAVTKTLSGIALAERELDD